jgi:7,8-dihydropterin-6-yl-methyl-4-(beta-D-ribofuranosyl)aminobenzene 5'-phosphate synthase
MNSSEIKIYNIFDNDRCEIDNLTSLWGFSAYIETPVKTILFDTGSNGRELLKNIKSLNLDISKIDTIFLSHFHWDHIGGIDSILEENSDVEFIVSRAVSNNFINDMRRLSRGVRVVEDEFFEIDRDIYSTGAIGKNREHSLVIDSDEGVVVISGCAHGNIENIAQKVAKFLNKDILLLMGGFHLSSKSEDEIEEIAEILKSLNTKYIAPSHCTGKLSKEIFNREFEGYIDSGVGRVIEFR